MVFVIWILDSLPKGQWYGKRFHVMGGSCYRSPERLASHGPLTRYAKLRDVHAPGMPGTFSRQAWISDPDIHQGTCIKACMLGSLTNGSLWNWWRGKRFRYSGRMRNSQIYVSGKRPIIASVTLCAHKELITTWWYRWQNFNTVKNIEYWLRQLDLRICWILACNNRRDIIF